ncbi:hypothetical protein [Reinekea marinisedimentorum]|uniref:Heparanase 1 n=1 Tax=Reinekea marinisedimentorum TaxID=230495 RepID=A0A4R3IBE6_9GAMM|nr:hypothetical protein [Reinekea marinisedimentorum]TCS43940.1 heparanase 1 [Reinekea marinisedimentorum]
MLFTYCSHPMIRKFSKHLTHPIAMVLELLVLVVWLFTGRGDEPGYVTLGWLADSYEVSEDFLGVAIDAAMLTDGLWWENSDSPPRPLDLTNGDLIKWTRILQPDWLRLGGTEADKLWLYEPGDEQQPSPRLNRGQLEQFLAFTEAVGAKPFITANAGPRVRREDHWQPEQLNRLLSWLPERYNGILEFGNEPGAHWVIFGRQHQIGFEQLAGEYRHAQALAYAQGIPLAGPANAFWPVIGEPLKQIVGSSKDFLEAGANPDIFTWHYYPTQSSRCGVKTENANWEGLLDVETQEEFRKHSLKVGRWLKQYSPDSVQWLGETGPAQCGGKAKLTDRFGASLWWLSHLATAASSGNKTVIRQSLMGGDYALLRYLPGYRPNPDYWATVLWQQNMGPRGFRLIGADGVVRAAAHCHPTRPGVMSMVIVNLSEYDATVGLPQAEAGRFIDVTSDQLESRYTFVEGELAESLDWQNTENLPWLPIRLWRELPAYSYRWVNIDDVRLCGDEGGSI